MRSFIADPEMFVVEVRSQEKEGLSVRANLLSRGVGLSPDIINS